MYRRVLLLLVLAGCADTSMQGPPPPAPTAPPSPVQAPPPAPPPATAPAPTVGGEADFDAWLANFRARAIARGLSPAVVNRELAGLTPNPRIVELDGKQPEFSKPVGDYIRGAISDARIAKGRGYYSSLAVLGPIERQYGVPREVLLGIWAMETSFGAVTGDFDVIRSLATLAYEGRRRDFAETQLFAALSMIDRGLATRAQLKGAWAGAMGQTQFIPETYLTTAVDGDGDGRRDIWGSSADALASAANLLAKAGWQAGQPWAVEVILPAGFDYGLSETVKQSPAAWAALGVRRADGKAWGTTAEASLLLPAGAAGPAFLAFPNHFAIRKYNNSLAYALAGGLLADRFAGAGPLTAPWPAETPLSRDDRVAAQTALARLGYDPGSPDGVVGAGTRAALRQWQKAAGLPADGYLSPAMVLRLKRDAGL